MRRACLHHFPANKSQGLLSCAHPLGDASPVISTFRASSKMLLTCGTGPLSQVLKLVRGRDHSPSLMTLQPVLLSAIGGKEKSKGISLLPNVTTQHPTNCGTCSPIIVPWGQFAHVPITRASSSMLLRPDAEPAF